MSKRLETSVGSILGAASVFLAACGGAGMGQGVRNDVTARMMSITPQVSACYKAALHERSRRIQGSMVVAFRIEAKTGKFTQPTIVQSDLADPGLEQCVLNEVTKLSLEKPQSTVVGVDSYPIVFSPIDGQ